MRHHRRDVRAQEIVVHPQGRGSPVDQSLVYCSSNFSFSFPPTMSTPAAPPPPDANGTAPKPKKPPLPPLELTQAEMAVIKQWTGVYEKTLSSKDRLEMLANKILPRLTPLNTHLTKDAWRVRKSVSAFEFTKIIGVRLNKISASQKMVPEHLPSAQCPCPVVDDPKSVPKTSCLPCLQARDCSHCLPKSKRRKTGFPAVHADFSSRSERVYGDTG